MDFKKLHKKAFGGKLTADSLIGGIIFLIILVTVMAIGLPQVNTAATNLSTSGLPFASFFASNGLIMLVIMGALLVAIIAYVRGKKH